MDLIFVASSKTFDVTQFRTMESRCGKNMGIQLECFTLGGYDWVLQFYPKETGQTNSSSSVYVKVLNATEECQVIYTMHQWNWTTSKWHRHGDTGLICLQPSSGDKARRGISYYGMKDLGSSSFLKNDTIRMKCDILVTPRPPAPAPPMKSEIDKPAGTGNQRNSSGANICFYNNGFHTGDYAPPNDPNNIKLPRQPTVRIYCKANKDLSLTIRNGTVFLAPANSNDYYQHWIKDMNYGDKVKDVSGLPAFALVNSVTGEALKNPAGENQEISLAPYNSSWLEDSVKWTEVWSTGFRAIRIADMTSLNLTAVGSNDDTNFSDGTKIVVKKWVDTPVQHWNIVPYNSSVPY